MANPIQKNDLISDDALRALEEMSRLLREDKENMDALMASFKQYAGSIQTATTANNGNNDALTAALQKVSELEKAYSDLQKLMKENAATQKAVASEKRKYAKLTADEAESVKRLSENIETYIRLTNSQTQSLKGLADVYAKNIVEIDIQKKSYNELYQTYNALKDALNKMTVEERLNTEAGKKLTEQSLKIRDTLNELQKSTGNYTMQVGKYRAAFDGLGYSFQQILREAPSALNLNQFFLAISNNIPQFLDQLKAFNAEQKAIKDNLANMTEGTKEYAEEMGKVMSVGQKLSKTLLSWQTGVLVLLMVLRNLPKIIEWFKKLTGATKDWFNALNEARKEQARIMSSVESAMMQTRSELELIINDLKETTQGTVEWKNAIARVNEITKANLDDTTATIGEVEKVTNAYLEQQKQLEINKKVAEAYAKQQLKEYALKNMFMPGSDWETLLDWTGMSDDKIKQLKELFSKQQKEIDKAIATGADYIPSLYDALLGDRKNVGHDNALKIWTTYGESVSASGQRLRQMYNDLYKSMPAGSSSGSGKEKEGKYNYEEVPDRWWDAEKALIRKMKEGYDEEIALQQLAHEKAKSELVDWLTDRENALYSNLMTDAMKMANGDKNKAYEIYNAIISKDEQTVATMSEDVQSMYGSFWYNIEEGQRQHDLIMQGLIIDNNEAIKAINQKYDKERMKQIEEESERELRVVKRRARTALQEKQRDEDLIHNIEVLIEEQRRLTTENYKEADSKEEASKEAEKLRKEIEKLQNQVDHSKRLSTKNSLTEIIKNFAIDNTSLGTARKSAEQLLGKDAYKAYDVRIKAAEENQLRAAELYGIESDEYKKATQEVADANAALKNAISKDWETIVANTVSGIKEWGSQMISLYQEMIQAEIDLANAKVEAAEKATEAAQEEYDKEKALLEAGYASRVEATWAEYQEKKAAQEKAEADAKAAAQRAKDLETAQQAINMVGASIDTYKAFAGIPVVGPAMGMAAVAAMWTLFINAKAKAAEVSKYGEGGFEVLEGGSHASGHDIDLGVRNRRGRRMRAEGKEGLGIFSRRAMNHYGDRNIEGFVNSINRLEFEGNAAKRMSLERSVGMAVLSAPRTDLHRVESDLHKLVSYGSRNVTVLPDGTVREIRKNGVVTIKKG